MDEENLEKRIKNIEFKQKMLLANQETIIHFQKHDIMLFQHKVLGVFKVIGNVLIAYAVIEILFQVVPLFF